MTAPSRRNRILLSVCTAVTGCLLVLYGWDRAPGHTNLHLTELWARDRLVNNGRTVLRDTNLVFVGITQPSYEDVLLPDDVAGSPVVAQLTNNFPWNRAVWAEVIDRLAGAGAKVVVLDLVFAAPAAGDDALRRTLERHANRVVIGANLVGGTGARGTETSVLYPNSSVLPYGDELRPWADDRAGFVNFFADADDVVRKATFRLGAEAGLPPGAELESLAARTLRKAGEGDKLPRASGSHLFRFTAPPGEGYPPVPLYELLLPGYWTNNFQEGRFFRDKIVFIGPAANIFHDEHRTPFPGGSMLGPEIHLNVIAAARRGEFLRETTWELDLLLIAAGGVLAWLLTLVVKNPARRLAAAVILSAAYYALCQVSYNNANYFLLVLTPIMALNVSTLAGFSYEFVLERRERNRTRRTLERYVSKDVVREVLDNPATYLNALGGVRKQVTILFSDVRGFTSLSEGADPAQLVMQLNEYFKEMVAIVFREQGSLDKFIGDAVMALWGSITSSGPERDAQHAVVSALEMRKSLARLNINWKQRGLPELAFGIGINHGDVIVGNLGSDQKMEVSVIGDAVNLASRLEGLTKEYKLDLLLGESVAPLVSSRFVLRTVDSVQVKGKSRPVRVFTVMADKLQDEPVPMWLASYERGVECYRTRAFADGAALFRACLEVAPTDHLAQLYLKRCEELLAHPPGPEWDTTFVMKTK